MIVDGLVDVIDSVVSDAGIGWCLRIALIRTQIGGTNDELHCTCLTGGLYAVHVVLTCWYKLGLHALMCQMLVVIAAESIRPAKLLLGVVIHVIVENEPY